MLAFVSFPSWLSPTIIPGLPVHWYGLMYLFAFAVAYLLLRFQVRERKLPYSQDDVLNYFFWVILGLILGARLLATTLYDPGGTFLRKPWLIFWPFDRNMRLVGLSGMSYHGGAIGAAVAAVLYCRKRKYSFLQWADLTAAGIPLGYTFGRLGNFINGELWGRVTAAPWGMGFPLAPSFPKSQPWVVRFMEQAGMDIAALGSRVNLPRHPSQLYEALFEGVVLWLFLWFVVRKRKRYDGQVFGFYLIGYGVIRFFIEYFREPDRDLGFIIALGPNPEATHLFSSFLNISTGQILCLLMTAAGAYLLVYGRRRHERLTALEKERRQRKESSRKVRKKLQ